MKLKTLSDKFEDRIEEWKNINISSPLQMTGKDISLEIEGNIMRDVKEKIQECEGRLKEGLCKEYYDRRNRKGFTESSMDRISQIEIVKQINKIFKEVFGENLR